MENAIIFIGIGGLVWIFLDIMNRGKKPATSPPADETPEPPPDIQRLFRAVTNARANNPGYIAEIREINSIARMYDAMRQAGTPAFFDLPDEQIMAVIQRYKGGAA